MRPRRGFTPRTSGCGPRSDGACTGSGVRAPFLMALLSLHRAGRKASAREPSQPWIRPPEQLLGRSRQRAPVGASPRGSAASRQGPGLVKNDLPDTPLPAPRSRVPPPSSRLTPSTSATSTHPDLPGPLLLRPGRSPAVFLPAVHGRRLDRLRDRLRSQRRTPRPTRLRKRSDRPTCAACWDRRSADTPAEWRVGVHPISASAFHPRPPSWPPASVRWRASHAGCPVRGWWAASRVG